MFLQQTVRTHIKRFFEVQKEVGQNCASCRLDHARHPPNSEHTTREGGRTVQVSEKILNHGKGTTGEIVGVYNKYSATPTNAARL